MQAMRFLGRFTVVLGVGLLIAAMVVWAGFLGNGPREKILTVAVTIPPQAELVEQIAGDRVRVEIAVPPGQDPHTFSPSPREVMRLGQAAVYFRIGLPLEDQLLPRLGGARPTMQIVDTTEGIPHSDDNDEHEPHADHGHHVDDNHDHSSCCTHAGRSDPHVWLAPKLLMVQAEHISKALCEVDPSGADFYRKNFETLKARLEEIDTEITAMLAPYKGRAFYVFHPAFGHFAAAYGLRQIPVEIEGKSPSPRQLQTLIEHAKADQVKVLFAQPQFDQRSAKAVASAIGGSVLAIDPLRRDVITNLKDMATALRHGLEQ